MALVKRIIPYTTKGVLEVINAAINGRKVEMRPMDQNSEWAIIIRNLQPDNKWYTPKPEDLLSGLNFLEIQYRITEEED